mgnify:CR=1 FL=1
MSLASLLKKGSLRGAATAIPATFATVTPFALPKVATVATVAVAEREKQAANDPAPTPDALAMLDPDRWCWPNSTAMMGSEIDLFTARLARFTDKGVNHGEAESLADKLVIRDRETDDRRLCLECTHLHGYGATSWRCGNWQAAKVAHRARDAQLPADLVLNLQRCDGLTNACTPAPVTQ